MKTRIMTEPIHSNATGIPVHGDLFSFRVPGGALWVLLSVLVLAACDSGSSMNTIESGSTTCSVSERPVINACELPDNQIVDGGPGKDGIPALTNPPLVASDQITYLGESDRVIGLMLDGEPVAIPHNVLWWHEILNYDGQSQRIAVTYCPLTGSSIVFDRETLGGAELGVSGLLYQNNLIMYDRNEEEALWSQMLSGARCNSDKGFPLGTISHVEMTWAGWKALHPDTKVIASNTGYSRNYTQYPYGDYEQVNSSRFLFPMDEVDCRRPPKERVLGIPGDNGAALTFPFGLLDEMGSRAVAAAFYEGDDVLVLWDREKESAIAFRPRTSDGEGVNIVVREDQFVDEITGSTFALNGTSLDGDLAGQQLVSIDEAYVAFWFAWPAFHPRTEMFRPSP